MKGVYPRLSQLLVTHLQELKAESRHYAQGDVVIEKQKHADEILLLLSGELSVEISPECELARIKPGEMLGEMGLSGDNRHSATVRRQGDDSCAARAAADTAEGRGRNDAKNAF